MRIMILGGYGVFGGRLAELLAPEPALTLVIAGRNARKAEAYCGGLSSSAILIPAAIDRAQVEDALTQYRVDLLVDASGPFQEYGADRYSVIEACIRQRVNYLDFADGSDFVFGVDRFDADARDAGVFVLAGVSSFPVLTAAVVQAAQLCGDVHAITGGIAPSPYAGVGLNVMRAVLGYAGGPVSLKRDGREQTANGLCESTRYTISPPGHLPLRNLRFSLVDVPDHRVIPRAFPTVGDIWMGAGPVPAFLHRLLSALAHARALLHLPSLVGLAKICHRVINTVRYGEHRGGMFIDLVGSSDAGPRRRSWHLLAEGDDGPYIPSMAIAILVQRALIGSPPKPGARAATGELSLEDYEDYFADRRIYTGFRDHGLEADSLFRATLGRCFDQLPASLQEFHDPDRSSHWRGQATIETATNPVTKLIARCFGFPTAGGTTPVEVTATATEAGENWHRKFGNTTFESTLKRGSGKDRYLICENFGWVTVSLACVWDGAKLWFVPRRWRLGPVPLPNFLLPRGQSSESEQNDKFCFDVRLELPIFGLIVGYRGTLDPV